MNHRFLTVTAIVLGGSFLTGCSALTGSDTRAADAAAGSAVPAGSAFTGELTPSAVLAENADYTTVNPDEWSEDDAIDIALDDLGSNAHDGDDIGDGVTLDAHTLTLSQAGVYRLSGAFDGQVVIDAPDNAQVVLMFDGADITNADGAAIDIRAADDAAIHLVPGSTNQVSDAATYADDADAKAAIHADTDLTISGTGALTVSGNGNDGISSTDDLVVLAGAITVTAADDALRGKDALVIEGGTLDLTAASDGLKSDQDNDLTRGYILVSGGTIDIEAGDDGLQAQTDTVITGGTLTVAAGDDGVKAEAVLAIGGGDITVTESVEAAEAAYIGISGGTLDLTASDDGINASGASDLPGEADAADGSADTSDTADTADADTALDAGNATPAAPGEPGASEPPMPGATTDAAAQNAPPSGERPEMPEGFSHEDTPEGTEPPARPEGFSRADMPEGAEMPSSGEMPDGAAPSDGGMGGPGGGFADTGERLEISGGTITVNAEGDGLDSNGSLLISDGIVTVHGPTRSGNGALDSNGDLTVTGGSVIALGAGGMEETPDETSTQAWVMFGMELSAGATVQVTDDAGTTVAEVTVVKQAGALIVSTSEIAEGEPYTLLVDGIEQASATAGEAASAGMRAPGQ